MKLDQKDCATTLKQVRDLIDCGRAAQAKEVLLHFSSRPPALQNALGVCLMRLGETTKAIDLFRAMVLMDGGVCIRPDAPPEALANFATALFLSGNVAGCEAILNEQRGLNTHGVVRLREAIQAWKRSLSAFRRLMLVLTGSPDDARVSVAYPLGEA